MEPVDQSMGEELRMSTTEPDPGPIPLPPIRPDGA